MDAMLCDQENVVGFISFLSKHRLIRCFWPIYFDDLERKRDVGEP